MKLSLLSPAKINLFLHITGRREDGYHSLSSKFQAVSLCDTLHIEEAKEDELICSDPTLPTDRSNLIFKALDAFRKATHISTCYRFNLEKRIPIQGGLGGGSSNAATTLFGLNRLNGDPLSKQELIQIGITLGSDVPFFFSSGAAHVSGYGEILREDTPLKRQKIHLITPPFGLSTPEVFKKYDEGVRMESNTMNDLEKAAFSLSPPLMELKEQLLDCGFDQVVMSGSGTSFFCLGSAELPYFDGYRMFIAEPIERNDEEWYIEYEEE